MVRAEPVASESCSCEHRRGVTLDGRCVECGLPAEPWEPKVAAHWVSFGSRGETTIETAYGPVRVMPRRGNVSTHNVAVAIDGEHEDGTPKIRLDPDGLQHLPMDHRRLLVKLLVSALGVTDDE